MKDTQIMKIQKSLEKQNIKNDELQQSLKEKEFVLTAKTEKSSMNHSMENTSNQLLDQ